MKASSARATTLLAASVLLALAVSWLGVAHKVRLDRQHALAEKRRVAAQRERMSKVTEACHLLCIASLMYAQEHNDRLPPAPNWEQTLKPYLVGINLTLPPDEDGRPRRFAMNVALSGRRLDSLKRASEIILFYESTYTMRSVADELRSFPDPKSNTYAAIGYVDGHCYSYPVAAVGNLIKRSEEALAASSPGKPLP